MDGLVKLKWNNAVLTIFNVPNLQKKKTKKILIAKKSIYKIHCKK